MSDETKSVKIGLAITPTESRALDFIQQTHGERYDGVASVIRDYSLSDAVEFHRRALTLVSAQTEPAA